MARYDARVIEPKWQAAWEEAGSFQAKREPSRPKFYVLEMFPYPSGRIHMGHVRNYAMGDVVARYKRARGFNVLHPMGWDAFGMPAENAAIERGIHPADWTYENIAVMKRQLQSMGLSLDWSREFATCDPEYYAQQQVLFLDMLEAGFVARRNAVVNWDPVDQTVLANEQVVDGRGWRSGAPVERRDIPQWFLKITDYADELLDGLDRLEGWPHEVKAMQRNWIGRSTGVDITFKLAGRDDLLTVFTTRPDTFLGVSSIVIAAEHPLAQEAAEGDPELAAFIEACRHGAVNEAAVETRDKLGHPTRFFALHPLSGERLP